MPTFVVRSRLTSPGRLRTAHHGLPLREEPRCLLADGKNHYHATCKITHADSLPSATAVSQPPPRSHLKVAVRCSDFQSRSDPRHRGRLHHDPTAFRGRDLGQMPSGRSLSDGIERFAIKLELTLSLALENFDAHEPATPTPRSGRLELRRW